MTNRKLTYVVREGSHYVTPKYKGYEMVSVGGRRRKRPVLEGTGIYTGDVHYETPTSHTGDWGDGIETKHSAAIETIATIAGSTDRALVERRTKAVFDALAALEPKVAKPVITFVALQEPDVRREEEVEALWADIRQ